MEGKESTFLFSHCRYSTGVATVTQPLYISCKESPGMEGGSDERLRVLDVYVQRQATILIVEKSPIED